MKQLLSLLILLCLEKSLHAQYIYTIKADSVKITNTCDTAELIIENHTQNVSGFLFNKGRGRTEFRRAVRINDSMLVFGVDTIVIQGNPLATNGLHVENRQVQLGGPLTQPVTTVNGQGNKTVVFDSLALFAVNSDARISRLAINIDPGNLGTTAVFGAKAKNSNGAFFRFYNSIGGARFALDLVNDEARFDMHDANGIANIRLQAEDISYFNGGNVGIGTQTPQAKLHVIGTGYFTDTLTATTMNVSDSSNRVATTAYVKSAIATPALLVSSAGAGDITAAVGTLTKLPDLTGAGSHSVSLPAASAYAGQKIYLWNKNSSSNSWTFATSITLPDGTTSNTIPNQSTIELISDGTVWIKWK